MPLGNLNFTCILFTWYWQLFYEASSSFPFSVYKHFTCFSRMYFGGWADANIGEILRMMLVRIWYCITVSCGSLHWNLKVSLQSCKLAWTFSLFSLSAFWNVGIEWCAQWCSYGWLWILTMFFFIMGLCFYLFNIILIGIKSFFEKCLLFFEVLGEYCSIFFFFFYKIDWIMWEFINLFEEGIFNEIYNDSIKLRY